jgi:hypothetical protein
MDLFTKALLVGFLLLAIIAFVGSLAHWSETRKAKKTEHREREAERRAIGKSIERHLRKTGVLPQPSTPPWKTAGGMHGRVLREANDGTRCFSTLELPSGDQVMISIAGGGMKIFRMKWRGGVPVETLWASDDPDEIAREFFESERPHEHPLEAARNRILTFDSADEIRALGKPPADHPALAKLTPEQRERLVAITDEQQRTMLLDSIEHGEFIPDFAWRPLSVSQLLPLLRDDPESVEAVEKLRALAASRGMTLQQFIESGGLEHPTREK